MTNECALKQICVTVGFSEYPVTLSTEKFAYTVFCPINGHSKRQPLLISGQFFFHRPNSAQCLIKIFLKAGQVVGHSN